MIVWIVANDLKGQFPALQSFAQGWQHTIKAIADEDKALHRDE